MLPVDIDLIILDFGYIRCRVGRTGDFGSCMPQEVEVLCKVPDRSNLLVRSVPTSLPFRHPSSCSILVEDQMCPMGRLWPHSCFKGTTASEPASGISLIRRSHRSKAILCTAGNQPARVKASDNRRTSEAICSTFSYVGEYNMSTTINQIHRCVRTIMSGRAGVLLNDAERHTFRDGPQLESSAYTARPMYVCLKYPCCTTLNPDRQPIRLSYDVRYHDTTH
jgi:hypothetical protein